MVTKPFKHTLIITYIWRIRIFYGPNFTLKLSRVDFCWFRTSISSITYLHEKNLTRGSFHGIIRRIDHIYSSTWDEYRHNRLICMSNNVPPVKQPNFKVLDFTVFLFWVSILKQELKKCFNESSRKYLNFSWANGIFGINVR